MDYVVDKLKEVNKTISAMESCTGGAVANSITSIPDASMVLQFSAITYSNSFKIKMGVSSDVIDKYSVYSIEVAREMARNIALFSSSNYGVGITGKLNKGDPNNPRGNDNQVFISIYDRDSSMFYDMDIFVRNETREKNKEEVVLKVIEMLKDIIK